MRTNVKNIRKVLVDIFNGAVNQYDIHNDNDLHDALLEIFDHVFIGELHCKGIIKDNDMEVLDMVADIEPVIPMETISSYEVLLNSFINLFVHEIIEDAIEDYTAKYLNI